MYARMKINTTFLICSVGSQELVQEVIIKFISSVTVIIPMKKYYTRLVELQVVFLLDN